MSQSDIAQGTSVDFGVEQFVDNAKIYRMAKKIVDAASSYECVDDAIVALRETWTVLEEQSEKGMEYTPHRSLGFGSDNASVIADSIMGRRRTVGAIRQSFSKLGK